MLRFAAKVLHLSGKFFGERGHYERLLHERHWTIGYNACKGAKTDLERKSLPTCKLCASDMTAADDTYDHTFRSCQHPLLCQARAESDDLLLTAPLLTDLDRRLFPVLLRLVQEVDGHLICMGNWNSSQITQLDQVLLPTDSVAALSESLLALSKHLVNRIDTLWAARQQAAYYTALSNTPEADPALLRTLQRRCLKRRHITASAPTVFYAVRLGHVPGIYTSWREAKPHTIGIPSDVKRFSTRKKAEEYMSKSTGPGDPLLDNPSAFLFTDGSALPNGSAGWGVHISGDPHHLGPSFHLSYRTRLDRCSACHQQHVGAQRLLSCLGLDPKTPASTPRYNLVSDSFYCVKPVAKKQIISRINALLDQVKRDNSISISWTPAHTNSDDPLAQGNAEADRLAARGCAAPHPMTQFRPPAPASRIPASAAPPPSRPRSRRRRSEVPLARSRSERPLTPRRDPRLPPFDSRQPTFLLARFLSSSC